MLKLFSKEHSFLYKDEFGYYNMRQKYQSFYFGGKIFVSVLMLLIIFILNACAKKPTYITDSTTYTSFSLDMHDIDYMVESHTKSLLSKRFIKRLESQKIIAISDIENTTKENIDIDSIVEQFKKYLVEHNDKFAFSKAIAGSAGKVDKMLKDSRKLRYDDEFSQYSTKEKGSLLAPDYSLSGKIARKNTILGKNMRVDYELMLSLTDIENGIEIWSNTAKISKIIPKDKIDEYTQSNFYNLNNMQENHIAMDTLEWNLLWLKCYADDLNACQKLLNNGLQSINQCAQYGCLGIGIIYEKMNQPLKAIDYYKRDIDLGNRVAYTFLGEIYNNNGNTLEAKKYLQIACDEGVDSSYRACLSLAILYEQEPIKAKKYFEITCEKGIDTPKAKACNHLGIMYYEGNEKLLKDHRKSFELWKTSCDLQYGLGCNNLGLLYEEGKIVTKSIFIAKNFYRKACSLESQEGCDNYKRLQR